MLKPAGYSSDDEHRNYSVIFYDVRGATGKKREVRDSFHLQIILYLLNVDDVTKKKFLLTSSNFLVAESTLGFTPDLRLRKSGVVWFFC